MASEVKTNKISPATGTDVTLGDSSDTFTLPSGSAITVASGGDINVASGGEIDIASGATLDVNGNIDATGATKTGLSFVKRAVICEQQASGVSGGTATSGSWQIKTLNTEIYDDIGLSIATNVFTLPAGTFFIEWNSPARGVHSHISRLYDVTNAAVVEYGQTAYDAAAPYDNHGSSIGFAKVTPSGSTGYRIEHQVYLTVADYGWGYPASYSVEKYTTVEIEQHA